MGIIHAEITLRNVNDIAMVSNGYKKPEEVRTVTVTAIADTGSMYPVITEELRQKLGLGIAYEKTAHIANGERVKSHVTESVEIRWKNRYTTMPALVIPGAKKVLFGALPLEAMDLMVDPVSQEVVGAHGDNEECLAL